VKVSGKQSNRRRRNVLPKRQSTFNGLHCLLPEGSTLHNHLSEDLNSRYSAFFGVTETSFLNINSIASWKIKYDKISSQNSNRALGYVTVVSLQVFYNVKTYGGVSMNDGSVRI
jgi:hypothetical protein